VTLAVARRRFFYAAGGAVALATIVALGAGVYVSHRLEASLPQLEGERKVTGLAAPVRIERDAHGVPVVRGRSRVDVARATGFLHAQERFFQMDLTRRRAAGELSELFGSAARSVDREVRVLRLRTVAARAVAALPEEERTLLRAYTEGVAAGLGALSAPPPEYLLLRIAPSPWKEEDSLLCALAMYLTLQGEQAGMESGLGLMHDLLPPALVDFLNPSGTEWDAPNEGEPFVQPKVPGPDVVDLRKAAPRAAARTVWPAPDPWDERDPEMAYGSNNWAVAGSHTTHGGALLADDMHLGLGVPNTWYRASLVFETAGGERRVTGVMLPGAGFVVVGSNGQVAWGFTNSQGDWADLVVLEPDPQNAEAYLTPEGPRVFEHSTEIIHVKGAPDERLEVAETIWGPVVDKDHRGRKRALAWVPLREGGLNAALFRLEMARDIDEAQRLAPLVGIPHQNFVTADAGGRIGWTIMGRIPRRAGGGGRLPSSWADGSRRWDGWVAPEAQPRITDPASGRIWTANSRVVAAERLDVVGFGGYDLGARQRQIRDDLLAVDKASEADMLRVQLDDRALFLARWQKLLLELLTPEAVAKDARRAEVLRLVEAWGERAAVSSAGYRIVRQFRTQVSREALPPLVAACEAADDRFDYLGRKKHQATRQWEGPLWALVTERPAHLLAPRYARWEDLLLGSLDAALDELTKDGASLAARTWGERNTALIQHPVSRAVPQLARYLDMPHDPLPGDSNMPRVQSPSNGASERLAVSPGHEERGYFHMPAGQSGHPRSPHYADGHAAWVSGEATPFLPGPAVHVLTLVPGASQP
jgi:penicillin amidase